MVEIYDGRSASCAVLTTRPRPRVLNREIPVGAPAQPPLDPALLEPEAISAICPSAHVLTAPLLAEIQGAGLGCYVWTVNEPAQMDRLVEWGVNGIITDRPGLLRARLGRS
jgi:glycerophosphoryl diester phosphodiesterase